VAEPAGARPYCQTNCRSKIDPVAHQLLVMPRIPAGVSLILCCVWCAHSVTAAFAQTPAALRMFPNLTTNIDRPLRYRPDGTDFVIENGAEFFNRSLYGGNTAFRVDGGDKPEFVLYLPGRGGNLRLGVRAASGARWLHDAAKVVTRYRPGALLYEIRDPLLGADSVLRLTALAYDRTEGLIVRAEAEGLAPGVELVWAYGGINGQRGSRDGDIGTERVPISEYFQLKPEFCTGNEFDVVSEGADPSNFTLRAKAATIVGVVSPGARLSIGDATRWNDLAALFTSLSFGQTNAGNATPAPGDPSSPFTVPSGEAKAVSRMNTNLADQGGPIHLITKPGGPPQVVVGAVALANASPFFLSLQRVASGNAAPAEDLATYREVGAPQTAAKATYLPAFAAGELPARFAEAEKHFADLRRRVSVDTPDAFLNAAVAALNVAQDAVWDEPQGAIMHGAIAWRTKLLGWRGPYSLDALGWHDRARQNFTYWTGRQNTDPIPEKIPPASEKDNLARNEAGLHTNGDISNSHYDMNLVFIDALFRHLRWTGDLEFAKQVWPVIERHLAWERRLFRREYGPEKLPLYEAYAVIWASDDLQYSGGGTMHASAYNYFHNLEAARLARLLGKDATPYQHEAQLLERSMRGLLWVKNGAAGEWFAESKDWLGLQRVHSSAALWTFYHTMDSEVPTLQEAWQMTRQVDTQIPHIPVRGPGVPDGLYTLSESNWMPYEWSINNVVMAEVLHTALGFWQAGRADEAWRMTKGSLLAAMFMGISPGNVGSMSFLDVYRRESQRDFGDGSGVMSRAIVEGLFGVKPDALAGELRVEPGFPAEWDHASLRHPDLAVVFKRDGEVDSYAVEQNFLKPQAVRLRLVARRDRVAAVTVDGVAVAWHPIENSVGSPRIDVLAPAVARHEIVVRWAGDPIRAVTVEAFAPTQQGQMRWTAAPLATVPIHAVVRGGLKSAREGMKFEPVDLTASFNDRVTQIFKNEYRSPRSPFVSLAMPKQGLGGWAGGVNTTAEIDDAGLRAAAAKNGGRIVLPDGVPFATPGPGVAKNVAFTSQWDNYPREVTVPLSGKASDIELLMAGSTGPMESRLDNGEVIVTYADGTTDCLALENPTTWWPIEQDYFTDDFQFRYDGVLPVRVDLKTGRVRVLDEGTFKGKGGKIPGGAATVLTLGLNPQKEIKSLTVRALANNVVIGLMAATLAR
jgi:hypothetical protein